MIHFVLLPVQLTQTKKHFQNNYNKSTAKHVKYYGNIDLKNVYLDIFKIQCIACQHSKNRKHRLFIITKSLHGFKV